MLNTIWKIAKTLTIKAIDEASWTNQISKATWVELEIGISINSLWSHQEKWAQIIELVKSQLRPSTKVNRMLRNRLWTTLDYQHKTHVSIATKVELIRSMQTLVYHIYLHLLKVLIWKSIKHQQWTRQMLTLTHKISIKLLSNLVAYL